MSLKYISGTSLLFCLCLTVGLLMALAYSGVSGFFQTYIFLDRGQLTNIVTVPLEGDGYMQPIQAIRALEKTLQGGNYGIRVIRSLISPNMYVRYVKEGMWIRASSSVDQVFKGKDMVVSDNMQGAIDQLVAEKRLEKFFSLSVFTHSDSRYPEIAGLGGALLGTFMVMFLVIILVVPLSVLIAVYLEELCQNKYIKNGVGVILNNMAVLPTILFGLLGLSVFINGMGMPRSSALIGGALLAIVALPSMTIGIRSALADVPAYYRTASMALGATKLQAVFGHVIPYALPGILTSIFTSLAQTVGQTAPLLVIGMVAFINRIPQDIYSATTVMSSQIYIWSDNPSLAFVEKSASAVLVLLSFLIILNVLTLCVQSYFKRKYF